MVLSTTTNFTSPTGVAVNRKGEMAIADKDNNRIRKVAPNGIISTIVGNGLVGFSGESGIAIDTKLYDPRSVTVINNREIIISGYGNRRIRKVDRNGIIKRIVGIGRDGYGGDGGSALDALINGGEVVVTDTGDILFADIFNNRIRKVCSNGTIVTIAGDGNGGFYGDGDLAIFAALNFPQSIAYVNGEVYIADTD